MVRKPDAQSLSLAFLYNNPIFSLNHDKIISEQRCHMSFNANHIVREVANELIAWYKREQIRMTDRNRSQVSVTSFPPDRKKGP